jgi:ABC-type multidrug transport system ATPase subunit
MKVQFQWCPQTRRNGQRLPLAFSDVELSSSQCLVLGRPGSGCSTFLKSIANRRKDYLQVEGDVLYAGITANEMERLYTGEVVYNQEGKSTTGSLFMFHLFPVLSR